MRKTLLAAAIAGTCISPLAFAEVYDAQALARGGTGMTMGGYSQALHNPALINRRPNGKGHFSLSLSGGAFASDKDELIEASEDFQDLIEELEEKAEENIPSDQSDIDATKEALQDLGNKLVQVDVGGSGMVAIPNKKLPLAFVVKAKASIGLEFQLDERDIYDDPAMQTGDGVIGEIADGMKDGEDLNSQAHASVLWLQEYGLMLGKGFNIANRDVDMGATLKLQTIELISYSAGANDDVEVEDLVDSNNLSSHTSFNVDLGATTRFGDKEQFVLAGKVENLIPKSFSGPNGSYKMAPVITAGAGYNTRFFKAEANLDLTQRNGYDLLEDTQFANVGIEISAGSALHLRAGYRTDLNSNVSDLLTAGIGLGNMFDISAGVGEGNTFATALRFAITF